jgi:colanic acid biosynthesis glycosyl transferase WcaI
VNSTSKSKCILYITQWYSPEPEGPAVWIAKGLKQAGYEVEVLTGLPNYPMGKIYPGYSIFRSGKELIDGIKVTRSPLYPSHDGSSVKRVLNYISFAMSSTFRGLTLGKRADAILVYSSPATSAIPAMCFKLFFKTPYVLLVQDLWPESVIETGMIKPGRALSFVKVVLTWFDSISTKHASSILVISPGMKRNLVKRGVPKEKIIVMYNWCDEKRIYPRAPSGNLRRELKISPDKLLLLYGGNQGKAQALDQWIDAMSTLPTAGNLEMVFIGNGTDREILVNKVDLLSLENVHFLDSMPLEKFLDFASDADYMMLSLEPKPIFEITIPSKLQTSLAMGKPILGFVAGDTKALIEEYGCGIVAREHSVDGLIELMHQASYLNVSQRECLSASAVVTYNTLLSQSAGMEKLCKVIYVVMNS